MSNKPNHSIDFDDRGILGLGFNSSDKHQVIAAKFGQCKIYSINGLIFDNNNEHFVSPTYEFDEYCRGVICNNLDKGFGELFKQNYFANTDEKSKFSQTHKQQGPFMLIFASEHSTRTIESPKVRTSKAGSIEIYRPFTKDEIKAVIGQVSKRISRAVASVYAYMNSAHEVEFVSVESKIIGISEEMDVFIPYEFRMFASGFSRFRLTNDELKDLIALANISYKKIEHHYAKHLLVALSESDIEKKYMKYFHIIEDLIRDNYSRIKKTRIDSLISVLDLSGPLSNANSLLVTKMMEKLEPDLKDKLVICGLAGAIKINDKDIELFIKLKRKRDDISHGNPYDPDILPIKDIKRLATKLIRSL